MFNRFRDKLPSFSLQLSTSPDRLATWQYVLLGILLFISCFYGLAAYPILDMNEGLYAEVAREMLVTHHWIIPYLNDVPYLEKPPLLYWLIAISYKIFGVNEFAARLVPSLFFALTALITFYFAKKMLNARAGFVGAIVLLTSLVLVMMGRTVFFDIALTYFICGSLFSFYIWYQENNTAYLYVSYALLALAILTKGFLALVLLPLIMLAFMVINKTARSRYRELFNKKAIILFLLIMLPWHILGIVSFSPFTWEYIINNQFLRFFNTRIPHDYHTGPIYYYIPRLIAYLLPWSIFLPFVFTKNVDPLKKFLWTWFLVMFVFFSLSGDKGDYYLVIGSVPLALLITQKIETWFSENNTRNLRWGFYGIITLLITAGVVSMVFASHILPVLRSGVMYLLLAFIVYGVAGFYICRKFVVEPLIPFLCIAGIIIPSLFFYLHMREVTQSLYSQKTIANYIKAQYEHRPLYLYQDFEDISSLVYYNREPSIIVDTQSSDLYFGSHTDEAEGKFISLNDFLAKAKTESVYIAMKVNKQAAFEKIAGKDAFCVIQRNGNVLLLSNAQADCHATIEAGEKKELNIDSLITKGPAEMPKDK